MCEMYDTYDRAGADADADADVDPDLPRACWIAAVRPLSGGRERRSIRLGVTKQPTGS